jgi:RND family efflux transporter MFP subunit
MNLSLIFRALRAAALASLPAAVLAATEFDCMIEPAQVVEVRSPVTGILQQVHAKRGAPIRKGEVLVTIESSVERSAADAARLRAEAQGALQQARARLSAAREKARRQSELYKEEFVSAQARDDAVAEMQLAQSELQAAQENSVLARQEHQQALDQLGRRTLRAPFDGVVMDQYLHPGALVDAGDGRKPILKIAQTHPLRVQAILPFRYFPQVKAGAAAMVLPEAPFGRGISATVKTVDRVIDAAAGTFGVALDLPNARQELPGGIRCKLRISGL